MLDPSLKSDVCAAWNNIVYHLLFLTWKITYLSYIIN